MLKKRPAREAKKSFGIKSAIFVAAIAVIVSASLAKAGPIITIAGFFDLRNLLKASIALAEYNGEMMDEAGEAVKEFFTPLKRDLSIAYGALGSAVDGLEQKIKGTKNAAKIAKNLYPPARAQATENIRLAQAEPGLWSRFFSYLKEKFGTKPDSGETQNAPETAPVLQAPASIQPSSPLPSAVAPKVLPLTPSVGAGTLSVPPKAGAGAVRVILSQPEKRASPVGLQPKAVTAVEAKISPDASLILKGLKVTGNIDFTGASFSGFPAATTTIIQNTYGGGSTIVTAAGTGVNVSGQYGGVAEDFSVGRNLSISGNLNFQNTSSVLTNYGASHLRGPISVYASITPSADATLSLGSPTARFANVFAQNNSIATLAVSDSLTLGAATGYNLGKFYVDSSGNVSASGTANILGNGTSTLAYGATLATTGGAVAIATSTAQGGAKLQVDGAVVFSGNSGATPVSGPGIRTMWIPAKGAFRTGIVDASGYLSGAEWDDANIGSYSFAAGRDNTASGYASTALGGLNTASNYYATALGTQTAASGNGALSTGVLTSASGYGSTAMGVYSNATGWVSTALGRYSNANGRFSTAIGYYAVTTSSAAMALGSDVSATGASSTAIGSFASSTAANSIVIGSGVSIDVPFINSTANSLAIAFNSTVPTLMVTGGSGAGTYGNVGIGTAGPSERLTVGGNTSGIGNIALGDGSTTSTLGFATSTYIYAHPARDLAGYSAFTLNTTSTLATANLLSIQNNSSNVFRVNPSTSTFSGALAVGTSTASIPAKFSVDGTVLYQGNSGATPVSGLGTRLMWIPAKAAFRAGAINPAATAALGIPTAGTEWDDANIGSYSTALGLSSKASGNYSTAIGVASWASGLAATAFGATTTASNTGSTAMGGSTIASGEYSTALGYFTTASGQYSTALGYYTTASGLYSTALGHYTTASGNHSTALGYYTDTNSAASVAMGYNTSAKFNSDSASVLFVFGQNASTTANGTAVLFGSGVDAANPMVNSTDNSFAVGFNSTVPTLMITGGSGAGTY
ncbi:MAG: hypothetical protein AAB731_02330, partial [Patescibacteria group bacterium]